MAFSSFLQGKQQCGRWQVVHQVAQIGSWWSPVYTSEGGPYLLTCLGNHSVTAVSLGYADLNSGILGGFARADLLSTPIHMKILLYLCLRPGLWLRPASPIACICISSRATIRPALCRSWGQDYRGYIRRW